MGDADVNVQCAGRIDRSQRPSTALACCFYMAG
jgi:hypothetical protein